MAISAGVFLALLIGGYFLIVPIISALANRAGVGSYSGALGAVLYILLWFFLAGVIFLGIASFLSSLLWDRLSIEIETLVSGSAARQELPPAIAMADSVRRTLLSIGLALVALCASFIPPFIWPVVIAGYVGLIDYTSNAYARRGIQLAEQRRLVRKLPEWASFWLIGGLVTIVPVLNVLFMPIMVAAGTIMVTKGDQRRMQAPAG